MSKNTDLRVLAIAPGTKHLGLAFFEGPELVRFGVKTFPGRKTDQALVAKALKYLNAVLEAHRPRMLAIEDAFYAQRRRSPLLRNLITALGSWGQKRGLRVVRYSPIAAKEQFCTGKRTRRGLAEAMVRRYWFLYSFLKSNRTRNYWLQMFDAVALGAVAVQRAQDRPTIQRQIQAR